MTHYAMELIMERWIEPHIDTAKWEFYDLSCVSRDKTDDKVTALDWLAMKDERVRALRDAVLAGSARGRRGRQAARCDLQGADHHADCRAGPLPPYLGCGPYRQAVEPSVDVVSLSQRLHVPPATTKNKSISHTSTPVPKKPCNPPVTLYPLHPCTPVNPVPRKSADLN